ncbi:hypothetical protein ACSBR2_043062 [Camellia fascicularis]
MTLQQSYFDIKFNISGEEFSDNVSAKATEAQPISAEEELQLKPQSSAHIYSRAAVEATELSYKYLLQVESVKEHANAKNKNGFTALDVVEDCPNRDLKQKEIRKFLLQAGARRAQDLGTLQPESLTSEEIGTLPDSSQASLRPPPKPPIGEEIWTLPDSHQAILHPLPTPPTGEEIRTLPDNPQTLWNKYFKADDGWFKEVRGHLITASTLTATMAYQAALSPPGSVWQDGPQGKNETTNDHSHIPGTSILASTDGTYVTFVWFNTASLIASQSTLLLALSGFPPENKFLLFLLMSTMFCSITCMAFAYLLTLGMISPSESWDYVGSITSSSFIAWVGVCIFVVLLHITRFGEWLWRKCNKFIQKRWPTRQPNNENNVNSTLRSNFFEWLWLKSGELVQKDGQQDDLIMKLMSTCDSRSETTNGTSSISIEECRAYVTSN